MKPNRPKQNVATPKKKGVPQPKSTVKPAPRNQ
jgi:hypothetical protein